MSVFRQLRLDGRTFDDQLATAAATIDRAIAENPPVKATFCLFSGGNDSTVLLDVVRHRIDAVVHINTGIGIPETNAFVRDVCNDWKLPLLELHPPEPYEEVIAKIGGFPGPMAHRFIYTRLKERALRRLERLVGTRTDRIIYLSGIRAAESRCRMSYAEPIHRVGRMVWVNPLLDWDDADMAEYRQLHPDLPRNEVSDHLHMSGECLCGAFAKPGELDAIALFYPAVAQRIRDLEARGRAEGWRACKWGVRPPDAVDEEVGPMCSSCSLWTELDFDAPPTVTDTAAL